MTLKFSTGFRDNNLSLQATVHAFVQGVGLAFVDGGASEDTITDSGSGFVTAGFAPNDILFVNGATTSANDSGCTGAVLSAVVAGTLTVPTGTVNTAEAGAAATIVACARGGSFRDIFKDSVIRVYSGSQPSGGPDAAATGTLLIELSESAGTFAHGAFANGLEFGASSSAVISMLSTETWQGVAAATGTAGWFRLCANATDAGGASTTLSRVDGAISVSGSDFNMTPTSVESGKTYTVNNADFTLPEYYGA